MAFALPQFNLLANVWHAAASPPVGPPDFSPVCQLYVNTHWTQDVDPPVGAVVSTVDGYYFPPVQLRVPALTDLRYSPNGSSVWVDTVEVPAGSARYYAVVFVEDCHKGFANEYRVALIRMVMPVPVPLP
jgi:hypothetical protein